MNIEELYRDTLAKLKKGQRPLLKFSEEELQELIQHWNQLNDEFAPEESYLPLLCLLGHTHHSHQGLLSPLQWVLENRKEKNLLIFTLSASLKIIIGHHEKKGERLPAPFLFALKAPLSHPHPEVQEWSLRVIEACGQQSILLKKEVLQQKPGIFSSFVPHKKNVRELIELLEKKWSPPPERR